MWHRGQCRLTHTFGSVSQGRLGRMLGLEGLVRYLGRRPMRVRRSDRGGHLRVAAGLESVRKGGQVGGRLDELFGNIFSFFIILTRYEPTELIASRGVG